MMRAAILLECSACGARFCWQPFNSRMEAIRDAHLASQIAGLAVCPTCSPAPIEGALQFAAGSLAEQRRRAAGEMFLDGRPRAVTS